MSSRQLQPDIIVGPMERLVGSRSVRYSVELTHHRLHKHRVITGVHPGIVQAKLDQQLLEWEAQWWRAQQREAQADKRARAARTKQEQREHIDAQKATALRLTQEARAAQASLKATLAATLLVDDAIQWDSLKRRDEFGTPSPTPSPRPAQPKPRPVPREPTASDTRFRPDLGLLDWLISSRRQTKKREAAAHFERAHDEWIEQVKAVQEANAQSLKLWQDELLELEREDAARREAWLHARETFGAEQQEQHAAVDAQRARYEAREPAAIEEYCDMVLAASAYSECFPKEWEMEFNAANGMLVVDYLLPAPDALPTVTEVKYIQASDEFTQKHVSEAQLAKLYDDLVYQTALRTIHELFEADQLNTISSVVFNGVVTALDRSTGQLTTNCVLSLQAPREQFGQINLAQVDPKACFRSLRGVGSSALHSITAVPPIITLSREDARFIVPRSVTSHLSEGFNLAMMPWEDFEQLIREVFEKEFSVGGGEVKVTQASRDGGVDAVAFDPDPIRGGKIVIQAKRYANTVGVSAVRDLFGTVVNEGATKGILVTTSDYGPDAYDFARGKPLTLLNGGNLLHLLEKHGLKAHIDLDEAKAEAKAEIARRGYKQAK